MANETQLNVKLLLQGPSVDTLYGKRITWRNKGVETTHIIGEVIEELVGEVTKYYGVVPLTYSRDGAGTFLDYFSTFMAMDRKFMRVINGNLVRDENPTYSEDTNSFSYKYHYQSTKVGGA